MKIAFKIYYYLQNVFKTIFQIFIKFTTRFPRIFLELLYKICTILNAILGKLSTAINDQKLVVK